MYSGKTEMSLWKIDRIRYRRGIELNENDFRASTLVGHKLIEFDTKNPYDFPRGETRGN